MAHKYYCDRCTKEIENNDTWLLEIRHVKRKQGFDDWIGDDTIRKDLCKSCVGKVRLIIEVKNGTDN